MQHHLSLTPATQAILDAVRQLGRGNVHELADKSGKARSTTDKAIKTLADAGMIIAVDTDIDAAEGTPTRWTLAEGVAAEPQDSSDGADLGDDDPNSDDEGYTDASGTNEPGDDPADNDQDNDQDEDDDEDDDEDGPEDSDGEDQDDEDVATDGGTAVVQPSRPGDRKVMAIKMVLSEHGDHGVTLDEIVAESGVGHPTASRLLTAMEQADAARRLPGRPARWTAGPTKASEVDPNPEPPRCPLCLQVIKGLSESPEVVTQVQPLVRPDGTLHLVAEDGTVHTVTLPKRMPTRTLGFATARVQRTDATVNADGSQPFARGELETLTFDTLRANPGRTMTPQEIATAITHQLGGRTVSSGAVRNNCGKLGAAGRIVMVSESPWAFQYPEQTEADDTEQADDTTADRS